MSRLWKCFQVKKTYGFNWLLCYTYELAQATTNFLSIVFCLNISLHMYKYIFESPKFNFRDDDTTDMSFTFLFYLFRLKYK